MHVHAVEESASDALREARRDKSIPSQRIDAIRQAVAFEQRVAAETDDAVKAILIILFALADDDTGIIPMSRVNEAERHVRSTLYQTARNLEDDYRNAVGASAKLGMEAVEQDIKKMVLIFTALAFLQTAQESFQQIISYGSRGVPFDDFGRRVAIDAAQNVRGVLTRGATMKRPVTALRKLIREEIIGKGIRSLQNRLIATGSQDITSVYSISQLRWAQAHKTIVRVRWNLHPVLHRVVDICDEFANRDYHPDSPVLRAFPAHIGCRCFLSLVAAP